MSFFDVAGAAWGMKAPRDELRSARIVSDATGYSTVKLAQFHDGVPVEGMELQIALGRENEVRVVMGAYAPGLALDTKPSLSAKQAKTAALKSAPTPGIALSTSLVILAPATGIPGIENSRLAWKVELDSSTPGQSRLVFLDAKDGSTIQDISRDLGLYREVWQPQGETEMGTLLMNESGAVGGYTPDNDALAVYNSVRIYDNYLSAHGISSFTNQNDWYKSVINSPAAIPNGGAYFHPDSDWTKAYAAFASTGVSMPGPAIDVVSHEWTHGLLIYTGHLYYFQPQSAALHEALADAVACMVDSNDWAIGDFTAIRRLDNPDAIVDTHGSPLGFHDYYPEYNPSDGNYKNSTIFSHAVFLFGDSGYNVHRDSQIGVQGIGRTKAGAILMRAILHYLFAYADFQAARWAVLSACEDLQELGIASIGKTDCSSVRDAFRAVGIPTYQAATVHVSPLDGNLSGCIDESGSGFPPGARVTLVFADPTAGVQSRENVVMTDNAGRFAWHFGLTCAGADAVDAASRANEFLDRVDLQRADFTARPMHYWAEFSDGGVVHSNTVDYTLGFSSCVPICAGKNCGPDSCGGYCGTCAGTQACNAGTCVASAAPATSVCGNLNSPTHWTLASSPVLLTCDVTVNSSLTIDPGVVVEAQSSSVDLIVGTGATLTAIGSVAQPILFTSDGESVPSSWGGIDISPDAAAVTISDAEIRFGGSTNGTGYPLQTSARFQPNLQRVTLTQNRVKAVGLRSGNLPANGRLNVVGIPYWVSGDVTVNAGVTLTVDPGVIVKFEGAGTELLVNGRLIADGSSSQPISFTSVKDDLRGGDSNNDGGTAAQPEDWGGIYLAKDPTLPASSITNATIAYSGYGYAQQYPLRIHGQTQPTISAVSLVSSRRNGIGLVTGSYSANLRLNVVGLPYIVDSDLTVAAGATMTVDPGVIVKFEGSGTELLVNGRLAADGTSSQPIYFTSIKDDLRGGDSNGDGATAPLPEDWGGIYLAKDPVLPPSSITNATIAYSGYGYAQQYPLRIHGQTQPTISAVRLLNSRRNAIGLVTGSYATNLRLNVVDWPYIVDSDLTVAAGATMTVDPGVIVKFEGAGTELLVNGRLVADGTASQPIYFTSVRDDVRGGDSNADGTTAPQPEDWGGIYLAKDPTLPASSITNATIAYSGYGYAQQYPLRVHGQTQPTISAVELVHSRRNAIGVVTGSYSANLRLNVVDWPYIVDSDLVVAPGVTMTVDPGVIVKFEGAGTDLIVNGTLIADGSATLPIYFTSYKDDLHGGDSNADGATAPAPGNWGGILFASSSTSSSVSHAIISYGGYDGANTSCALVADGSSPKVEGVSFLSNDDAVCVSNGGQPDLGGGTRGSLGGNQFQGHDPGSGNWAVWNDSTADIPAHNNWWGSTSVSFIDGVIRDKQDNAARGRVLYDGYEECLEGQACNDGNACTFGDSCVAGHCTGTAYACNSPGVCQIAIGATCNGDGSCSYPSDPDPQCGASCHCDGTGPSGPVTVSCGQSACGQDLMTYNCSSGGWSLTGQACSASCQCQGTGPGNTPLTVDCGQTACGSDYYRYSCDTAGWSWTGQACTGNADAGSGPCQCTGTGPGGASVTVDCGQTACGSNLFSYSCSASGWALTGQTCSVDSDAGVAGCQCTGTGPGGAPVTASCGNSACGSNHITYACSASGWSSTGQGC